MTPEQRDILRKEKKIVKISGKEFITVAGLHWLAEQQGLISITSTCIYENYETKEFCFRACVRGLKVINGEQREVRFIDEGDANPKNVGRQVVHAVRRMASTRAIARALRWYTSPEMCALEELSPEESRNEFKRITPDSAQMGYESINAELRESNRRGAQR